MFVVQEWEAVLCIDHVSKSVQLEVGKTFIKNSKTKYEFRGLWGSQFSKQMKLNDAQYLRVTSSRSIQLIPNKSDCNILNPSTFTLCHN
jgi:hypothetical protein